MLTIQELRAFVAVARHSSFTQAAHAIGVTQPALSMTIRHFEEKLGTALFDRSTRSVRLTAVGELLLPVSERQVDNFDRTSTAMLEIAAGSKTGHIVIACPEGVAARLLSPIITEFANAYPNVSISLEDGDATSVARAMHSFTAELAITGYWTAHPDFSFEPFAKDQVCVVCPADHHFARRRRVRIEELHRVAIVSLTRRAGVRMLMERVAADLNISLNIQFEVARVSTLIEMVGAGLCVSVLPLLSTPSKATRVKVVPLVGPGMTYDVGIVYAMTRSLSPGAQRFLDLLRSRAETNSRD